MKKIIYLASLLLVVATVNVGCEKESNEPETPPVVVQTLEQKYPDWKNLTWVSTYDITYQKNVNYPIITCCINKNIITVNINYNDNKFTYDTLMINKNIITFKNKSKNSISEWYYIINNNTVELSSPRYNILLKKL